MLSYRVRNYVDYRELLNAVFGFEKAAAKSKFSKKKFAHKIGLSDSNFRMICLGQRNLTSENAITICQNLKFSRNDTEYFMNLVYVSNLKNLDAKQVISRQLKRFDSDSRSKQLDSSYRDFVLDSKLQVVLIFIKDTNLNIKSEDVVALVSKKFKYTVTETKQIIQKISELGMFLDDPQGFHIIYSKLSNSLSRNKYLKNEFLEAARLTNNSESSGCLFSTKTFSIHSHKISEFAQEYKKLTEKYMQISNDSESDLEVVRVLFHLRPMTVK